MVTTSVKCSNFLYKGTLAAFDNGVKLIVMHRYIVSIHYSTTEIWKDLIHIWQSGSQLLQLLHTDETVSRKHLMLKFFVAEIIACRFERELYSL